MARKARLFSTAPVSAMLDRELTGLEWRALLWVSLHDGMSLVKGKGSGCYASNKTIFAEVGCDYASGCRALSKLVQRGHLVREQVGRSTRYRVVFGAPDMLQARNLSSGERVAGSQGDEARYVAEHLRQTADNAPEPASDYSSLSEELDSTEAGELNSSEEAHLGDAHFPPEDDLSFSPPSLNLRADRGKEAAKAGLGSEWALAPHLPHNLGSLPPGAQVARIESAFGKIGRDPERLHSREREALSTWLFEMAETFTEEPFGQQAQRLSEEIAQW